MEVPFLDLKKQQLALKDRILPLWEDIFCSAGFIGGNYVETFEQNFAKECGVTDCVALNSGTDALRLILLALNLSPGDEVITVPNTFIATTEAISQAGGKIVFVDVDPDTFNMNPDLLEAAITPRTRVVLPVHLYGQPAEMGRICEIAERHGLLVVEDACQAHLAEYNGRRVGSLGVAGAFSFYPGKNLGACGDAGAITTTDAKLAAYVRKLRDHGQASKYYHEIEGYNARCDALQAAALNVKLSCLPEWNSKRRRNAALYDALLKNVAGVIVPKQIVVAESVYHLYVILVDDRDRVSSALQKKGVSTGLHYPQPLHLQEAYAGLGFKTGSFPVVESCAEKLISLPMFPELSEEQIKYVCSSLIGALSIQ